MLRHINRAKGSGLQLMSDNGCQPTSLGFMQACALVGIQQALAKWIDEYNHHYLHSALGYLPPVTFEQNTHKKVA